MLRFDIHGVNVEIHGENRRLHDFLLEQLGFFSNNCFKKPDVTIEFVSHIATPPNLKSIGNQAIFGNSTFYAQIGGKTVWKTTRKYGTHPLQPLSNHLTRCSDPLLKEVLKIRLRQPSKDEYLFLQYW